MKTFIKLIITIYIFSVLAWSGLLRAEDKVVIDHVSFNEDRFELQIQGHSFDSCGLSLTTRVVNHFTEEDPIIVVRVVQNTEPSIANYCVLSEQVQGMSAQSEEQKQDFDMILDVRSLGLRSGASYVIAFDNKFRHETPPMFSLAIPGTAIFVGHESISATGLILQTLAGDWVLVNESTGEFTVLKSRFDLSKYENKYVTIQGMELLHQTGPTFELNQHNPLFRVGKPLEDKPTMLLLSISGVSGVNGI